MVADYISREAAIEKITALINESGKYTAYESGAEDACYIVEHEIPAADVQPVVRGQWEDVFVRDYSSNINGGKELYVASMFCPICHRWHNEVYHYGNPIEMAHFCSNCGADLRDLVEINHVWEV